MFVAFSDDFSAEIKEYIQAVKGAVNLNTERFVYMDQDGTDTAIRQVSPDTFVFAAGRTLEVQLGIFHHLRRRDPQVGIPALFIGEHLLQTRQTPYYAMVPSGTVKQFDFPQFRGSAKPSATENSWRILWRIAPPSSNTSPQDPSAQPLVSLKDEQKQLVYQLRQEIKQLRQQSSEQQQLIAQLRQQNGGLNQHNDALTQRDRERTLLYDTLVQNYNKLSRHFSGLGRPVQTPMNVASVGQGSQSETQRPSMAGSRGIYPRRQSSGDSYSSSGSSYSSSGSSVCSSTSSRSSMTSIASSVAPRSRSRSRTPSLSRRFSSRGPQHSPDHSGIFRPWR